MDFRQLKYFARIVELESMTAAARSLFVAQPSLSQHIANLEASVGVKLLVRGAQGTRPTRAGELLYRYAKTILRQVDEASDVLRQGLHEPVSRVSVGLPPSTLQMVGQDLILALRNRPGNRIVLEIVEGSTSVLADSISRQLLDIAITVDAQPHAGAQYESRPILSEELLAVGACGSKVRSSISLEALSKTSLILPAFPNSVRVRMESACLERNLTCTVSTETASAALMTQLAASGAGWTVLPWAAAYGSAHRTKVVRIKGAPLCRTLSLCKSNSAAAEGKDFVADLLYEVIKTKVESGAWKYVRLCATPD